MIPETQRNSFHDLQPKLGDRQQVILEVIRFRPQTLHELSKNLDMPINRISGRVTELREMGLVVDTKTRRINPESGKKNIVWAAC